MGQISLSGVIVLGPSGSSVAFPGAETTIPLVATNNDYAVSSPAGLMNVNSASAYVAMPGVGAAGPVTAGRLLYVRTDGPLSIRMTAGSTTAVVMVDGLLVTEFAEAAPLTLLEVEGVGRVEYLVAGQS
jgi:hypothetical protein